MNTQALSPFEVIRQLQAEQEAQDTVDKEKRLVNDGTWPAILESYEPMAADRLPTADVVGYRLCYKVDEHGEAKRVWFNVFFSPVHNAKGLVIQSQLGASLAKIVGVSESSTFEDILEKARCMPMTLRVQRKEASNGYAARNAVWAISAQQ